MANPPFMPPGPGIPGLVSIIIPCYNRADIVRDTIDSVLSQTYVNFEVIVIDDGSTDNTAQVVRTYSDRRIRYFYKANGGLSAARNSGLDSARGEFIAFLDSDDVWQPWKLSAQVELLRRHPEAGLVWTDMSTFAQLDSIIAERHLRTYYSAYNVVNVEGTWKRAGELADVLADAPRTLAQCPYYVADVFPDMFSGNLVHPSTAIVRRARLWESGPFQPEVTGHGAEDYHFYFRITSLGPVAFLDAPSTLYRLHPAQLSTCNSLHEARGNLSVIEHWLDRRPAALSKSIIQRSLAASYAWVGAEELFAGNTRVASRHLWQSIRLQWNQPPTLFLLLQSLMPHRTLQVARALKRVAQPQRLALHR